MRFKLILLALPVLLAARPHITPPAKKAGPPAKASGTVSSFSRFDLTSFWQLAPNRVEEGEQVHNGFFGYNFQRLEMVFTSVRRDARHPEVYHVRGKSRRYNTVRPFAGTFTLAAIRRDAAAKPRYDEQTGGQTYFATGQFVLREQARPGDDAHGTFQGTLAVDFSELAKGRLQLNPYTANGRTRNGGFLLDGTWKDAGSEAEVVVLVKNGTAVTTQVLENFELGGRSSHINRKYARVGWNTYWENKEWWADGQVARR